MSQLIITGGSDDLIEITGSIREEFNVDCDNLEKFAIAVSDGTVLSVDYDNNALWRFNVIQKGKANLSKIEGSPVDDSFDVITLTSDEPFKWVIFGEIAH